MLTTPLVVPEIRSDDQGSGEFLAPRAGRVHFGRDYRVAPGQPVFLARPADFVKIGTVYSGAPQFKYVEYADGPFFLRYMYVLPVLPLHKEQVDTEVGYAQDIARHYGGGMQNHVHLECYYKGSEQLLPPGMVTMYHSKKDRTYFDPADYLEGRV